MGVVITGEINGAHELSVELEGIQAHLRDFETPLTEAKGELLKAFDLNFQTRGQEFGGWAPRKVDKPWPLMEKTGNLRHGFRGDVQGDTLTLSNDLMSQYGKYHQLGTRKMPARVLMKLDEARRTLIVKIFQRHMIESLKGK